MNIKTAFCLFVMITAGFGNCSEENNTVIRERVIYAPQVKLAVPSFTALKGEKILNQIQKRYPGAQIYSPDGKRVHKNIRYTRGTVFEVQRHEKNTKKRNLSDILDPKTNNIRKKRKISEEQTFSEQLLFKNLDLMNNSWFSLEQPKI